ncbi:ABC transporter permease [Ketogulonicigenium vulgare]|uniref:Dipeptide transport system permease protein dppC n=1 Tax=Ketogulonicigenium vulgare (strain WSH-001) TaxID=759362 RepID=F9Y5Z1_KETVW|nr:ABC transporter permease [Ketogulonicigenium vulgare]AEM40816.1 Dipeptide transport system permease protein dppC [Ketogulonicigenium vulgare WSH-001]ALJ80981.1 peptide ABC transporter permease [Ketogulonicigenium vulgare]ANW33746.1 peptide ABC transporter permease [Ketogulonicigenium vulgare]
MSNLVLEATSLDRHRPRAIGLGLILSGLVFVFIVFCALAPQVIATHNPLTPDLLASLKAPSWAHLFGTDQLGRDIFSRTIYGARHSLYIAGGATLIAVTVGILIGLLSGAIGGVVDMALMRVIDILMAFPSLLMSMAVVAFLGTSSTNILLAIAIAMVPGYARIVRAQVLVIRSAGYVEAARILGQAPAVTLWRHILPNTIGPLVVLATLGVGSAILQSAALSYLGLGPKPPTPEWGLMLSEGQNYLRVAWWIGVFPGLFATMTIIATTVLGRSLKALSEGRRT